MINRFEIYFSLKTHDSKVFEFCMD